MRLKTAVIEVLTLSRGILRKIVQLRAQSLLSSNGTDICLFVPNRRVLLAGELHLHLIFINWLKRIRFLNIWILGWLRVFRWCISSNFIFNHRLLRWLNNILIYLMAESTPAFSARSLSTRNDRLFDTLEVFSDILSTNKSQLYFFNLFRKIVEKIKDNTSSDYFSREVKWFVAMN